MNIRSVTRMLSIILAIIALFMLLPVAVSVYYHEYGIIRSFIIPIIMIVVLTMAVLHLTRHNKRDFLSIRDGFLLVSSSWISASFFGAIPFYISGHIPSFIDAYFETMSGFTTTGATILTDIEALPMGLLFWRSLTHWLGGMGIVVLTVAVFPLIGIGGLKLIKAEAPGPSLDKISPRITQTAKFLWIIYLGLTAAEIILLMLAGMNLFDAVTHTFGTLATGGFSPKNQSIGFYASPYIHWIITIFMLAAGVNFSLYFRVFSGNIRAFFKNIEFRIYISIFIAAAVLISLNLFYVSENGLSDSIRHASFQSASILTTTGYSTQDFEAWPFFSKIILFTLMWVGGCSGSTGGGIKVIRIIVMFKNSIKEMKYLLHPRSVSWVRIGDNIVKKDILYSISAFIFLYVLLIIAATAVVASGGNDITTSISSALVTLGNIGPGFGKIGASMNYGFLQGYIKIFLSFIMMAGRLELFTVLVIFTPQFWKI